MKPWMMPRGRTILPPNPTTRCSAAATAPGRALTMTDRVGAAWAGVATTASVAATVAATMAIVVAVRTCPATRPARPHDRAEAADRSSATPPRGPWVLAPNG